MKKNMSNKLSVVFKKCILWVTGYLSIVAFVISGGYFFFKDEEKNVTDSCKEVFVLTAIFTALSAFNSLLLNFINVAGGSIGFERYMLIVDAIKIVVFVIFFILDLLGINIFRKEVTPVLEEEETAESTEEPEDEVLEETSDLEEETEENEDEVEE